MNASRYWLRHVLAASGARWREHTSMMLNSLALIGTQGVTSVLGFLFWGLAARTYLPEAVGVASAAISAMLLLGNLGMLGLGTLLIGELPRRTHGRGAMITAAALVAAAAGAALGMVFGLGAPWVAQDLSGLAHDPATLALFALGVGSSAAAFVLDQAGIGLLRADIPLWRNSVQSMIKLILLALLGWVWAAGNGMMIYATWTTATLASVIVPLWSYGRTGRSFRALVPNWRSLGLQGLRAAEHHALNLALMGPGLLLPLLVTALLSAQVNAFFYVAWMIASLLFVVPTSLTTVLFALAAAEREALAMRLRATLGLSLSFGVLAVIGVAVAGPMVLQVFGPAYAEHAGAGLVVLALGVFPVIVRSHFVALVRIQGRVRQTVGWLAAAGILELSGAALGACLGELTGFLIGWVGAVLLEACLMARPVWRATGLQLLGRSHDWK